MGTAEPHASREELLDDLERSLDAQRRESAAILARLELMMRGDRRERS